MRGGTANCVVIISQTPISSPILTRFDAVVALNQPSVDKFEKAVKSNGILMYDSSNIIIPPSRTDLTIVPIAVEDEVKKLKNNKVRNMIMLGAFLSVCEVVHPSSVIKALSQVLPERYHHLLDVNKQALECGAQLVIETATPIV
jgi:2-oxoglutarate ferredoxin oxidoreductase subunit gamma